MFGVAGTKDHVPFHCRESNSRDMIPRHFGLFTAELKQLHSTVVVTVLIAWMG